MQNTLVNVNGQIMKWDQAQVSVFDRSFMYGDSLYEVVRSAHGRFLHMKEHLARLEASAGLCRMVLGQKLEEYSSQMERTFREFQKLSGMAEIDVYCRLIVSRGSGKIGFGLANLQTPTSYVIIIMPLNPPSPEQLAKGYSMRIVDRLRNHPQALDPAMKSGNYLNSLLGFLEATSEGFDDALLCNAEGHLTEGTTFNIGYIKNKVIATPPLEIGILDGITRRNMIELARKLGYDVREVRFPKERLYEADEVFLTSTIKDVFPITRVDHQKIKGGRPGPITLKLRQAFQETFNS